MKTIIITFLIICYAVCNGQTDNSIKLQGWDYDSAYSTMQIEDDTGTVFYYSSQDSTSLFIGDSLRTIKWLIQLVVEDMKKHFQPKHTMIKKDTFLIGGGFPNDLIIGQNDLMDFNIITNQKMRDTIPIYIDSVQIWPQLPINILKETSGYKHFRDYDIDTCYLSKDTTFLIFKYVLPPIIETFRYNGDTIFLYKNNNKIDTLFMFNSMDSAVNYYRKKKEITYPIQ